MTLTSIIILLIIILGIFAFIISIYNRLIRMIEAIKNNKRQIDVQLDRRFKVFESLIEVVKKYFDYEQTTLKDVVALRSQAQQARQQGNLPAQSAAENQISRIAGSLNLVFEQYPDLKANQNALQLQEEIVNTENKLAYAKQAYNDSIERYNAEKKSFFQSWIVSVFPSRLDEHFEYWQLTDEQIEKQENYKVKLG